MDPAALAYDKGDKVPTSISHAQEAFSVYVTGKVDGLQLRHIAQRMIFSTIDYEGGNHHSDEARSGRGPEVKVAAYNPPGVVCGGEAHAIVLTFFAVERFPSLGWQGIPHVVRSIEMLLLAGPRAGFMIDSPMNVVACDRLLKTRFDDNRSFTWTRQPLWLRGWLLAPLDPVPWDDEVAR